MNKDTIALAINLPLPNDLMSFDHDIWPGSGWIKKLVTKANDKGFEVKLAKDLTSETKNVYLIQEELCNFGDHLIHANKAINLCLESVLYAKNWYDKRGTLGFKHTLEFGSKNYHFPSFDVTEIVQEPKFREKSLCMIIANKHYGMGNVQPPISQLHDYRYQVINWALNNHNLHLYGKGWDKSINGTNIFGSVDNKLKTLKEYNASIIIENVSKPFYFTEKFVHAMISGTIPIYYGDPVCSHWGLSAEPAFIETSVQKIKSEMFYDDFLGSRDIWMKNHAYKFTYDFFADNILKLIKQN